MRGRGAESDRGDRLIPDPALPVQKLGELAVALEICVGLTCACERRAHRDG